MDFWKFENSDDAPAVIEATSGKSYFYRELREYVTQIGLDQASWPAACSTRT